MRVTTAQMQDAVLKNSETDVIEIIDMIIAQEGITKGMTRKTVQLIVAGSVKKIGEIIEMSSIMVDLIDIIMGMTEIDVIMNIVDLVVVIGTIVVIIALLIDTIMSTKGWI
jgi:lipoprotein signal peptidase